MSSSRLALLVLTLYVNALVGCDDTEGSGSQTSGQEMSVDGSVDSTDSETAGEAPMDEGTSDQEMMGDQDVSGGEEPISDMGLDMMEPDMMAPDMMEPDMEVGPPECSNGRDDDGDGLIDYPRDPGCVGAEDQEEADPDRFACEDELDNDEDGLIDLNDPGCSEASDPSEASACGPHEAIDISASPFTLADSEGAPIAFEACRSNNAPEQVFLYTLRRPVEYLYFSTEGSAFDTLLSVRRSCDDPTSEVACNDDVSGSGGPTSSAVQLDNPPLGDYFIIVDGYGESAGLVALRVEGGVAEGEPCPPEGGPLVCPRGQACDLDGLCAVALCADREDNDGDGAIDYPADPGCERPEDNSEEDPDPLPECGDGDDNDRDGRADFPRDQDCESAADPSEAPDPDCDDGEDNDGDGLTDFPFDPGCDDASDTSEFNAPACDDGLDNDDDGLTDFPFDPGCVSEEDSSERDPRDPPQCADGIDNDGDGLTDFPDDELSCRFAADATEDDPCTRREFRDITGQTSARGNNEDAPNDFGGACGGEEEGESLLVWRVEADRPLASMTLTTRNSEALVALYARDSCEASEELFCEFNSGDQPIEVGPRAAGEDVYLFVDSRFFSGIWRVQINAKLAAGARCNSEPIPGVRWECATGLSCIEEISGLSRCVVPQCSDGADNDGDGRIDFPFDPGCESAVDQDEITPDPLPACANDVDEDRDGLFDFGEDPDCDSAADTFEGPDCSDGVDNDGDGRVDFAGGDASCVCADDPSESRTLPDCRDFCDNDGDGLIDMLDPGCTSLNDADEFNELQCRDGADNDGDGRTDYPADPGCSSALDDDETTPDPAPACGDDADNDGDGLTDFPADDGCQSASDEDEAGLCDAPPLTLDATGVGRGVTSASGGSQTGSCNFGSASEVVYALDLPHPVNLNASTAGSDFNTSLYARSACAALTVCPDGDDSCVPTSTELACNQDAEGVLTSALSLSAVSGALYLFVDGFGAQAGAYVLTVSGEYLAEGACDPQGPSYFTCPPSYVCSPDPENPEAHRCSAEP